MTNSGTTSRRVAERFGFAACTDKEEDIFDNPAIGTVFIATRHDSHAGYVIKALKQGKNVFVEKPLAMNIAELEAVEEAVNSSGRQLMVGFNRRFSPLSAALKKAIGNGPMSMIYRVNAGAIPGDSWIQDMEIGGGRMIGEGCHFIDYMSFVCGSLPIRVYASAIPDANGFMDTVNVNLEFANGSTGVVAYYANGSKALPKEYFEVHHAGNSAILHDFRSLELFRRGVDRQKLWGQNKGQKEMMAALFAAQKSGKSPISFAELRAATLASFAVLTSLREKAPVEIRMEK